MSNANRPWGPSHNLNLPAGLGRAGGGGYWWGITFGTWLIAFGFLGVMLGGSSSATVVLLTVVMTASAAGVGLGEAHHGKRFASGRWVLFTSAAIASALGGFFLPALAYAGGYFGWRWHMQQQIAAPPPAKPPKRAQRRSAPTAAASSAAPMPLPSISGAYFGVNSHGGVVSASARGAACVVGPQGSGKSQACILPSTAFAPGPCVSVTVKLDALVDSQAARSLRGRCWLFDPSGSAEHTPAGVIPLRWDPLCDVTDWDAARRVAARLTAPARTGEGAQQGDHWAARAETWLAVLLFAAKLSSGADDIKGLARWCINPSRAGTDAEAALIVAREDGIEGADIAAALLDSLLAVPDKERESIASTLARIMDFANSSAFLRSGTAPNFDPATFVRSNDTVYLTSPVDQQETLAPVLSALMDSIRFAQYARHRKVELGLETQSAPLTWVLDECANINSVPKLPSLISEAGGQGLHIVAAFQDLSQARARWGKAADGFLTLFPDKLILPGVNDKPTTDMLSAMSGEYDRMTVGISEPGRSRTGLGPANISEPGYNYHSTRTPVLSTADISGLPPGSGLHWSPRGWELITQTPWWQQRSLYGL